jgi:hypothetical protein
MDTSPPCAPYQWNPAQFFGNEENAAHPECLSIANISRKANLFFETAYNAFEKIAFCAILHYFWGAALKRRSS